MQEFIWSDWIVRNSDDIGIPKQLKRISEEDFQFRLGNEKTTERSGCFATNWGALGKAHRITSFRYKIRSTEPSIPLTSTEEVTEAASKESALRFNTGKPELSYILDSMPALKDMVGVMEFGANKYSRDNWKNGFPREKLLDSMLRHVDAFYSGEDIDSESGKPHVGHILCNAMFLAYHNGSNSEYWKEKYND
jgi:hypothetical protein